MIKIDEALKSALIRKDVKTVYAIMLDNNEMAEQAEEVRQASRFTKALVDRTCPKVEEEEKFEEPLPEFAEVEVEDAQYAIHTDIENLLAKGKGKKALKLIKASMANGTKGSVIKEQLAKAKQLKKDAK